MPRWLRRLPRPVPSEPQRRRFRLGDFLVRDDIHLVAGVDLFEFCSGRLRSIRLSCCLLLGRLGCRCLGRQVRLGCLEIGMDLQSPDPEADRCDDGNTCDHDPNDWSLMPGRRVVRCAGSGRQVRRPVVGRYRGCGQGNILSGRHRLVLCDRPSCRRLVPRSASRPLPDSVGREHESGRFFNVRHGAGRCHPLRRDKLCRWTPPVYLTTTYSDVPEDKMREEYYKSLQAQGLMTSRVYLVPRLVLVPDSLAPC